jgi:hypothetical protein
MRAALADTIVFYTLMVGILVYLLYTFFGPSARAGARKSLPTSKLLISDDSFDTDYDAFNDYVS